MNCLKFCPNGQMSIYRMFRVNNYVFNVHLTNKIRVPPPN